MTKTKRQSSLEYFRVIAAMFIIAIHISPLSSLDKTADYLITYCLFRIAVPFFLMITGCFVLSKYIFDTNKSIKNLYLYLKKICILYFISILIYLPVNIYASHIPFEIWSILKALLFDGTFYHLWYLPASLLGILLLLAIGRNLSIKTTIIIVTLLYVIGLFGDSYYGLICNIPIIKNFYQCIFSISSYTRNGIFYTPMFLLLGVIAAKLKNQFRPITCLKWLYFSILIMLIEGFITYYFNLQRHNSMYIFLIPVMFFLFIILLNIQGTTTNNFQSVSMCIYIIHPIFIILLRGFAKLTKLTNILVNNSIIQYVTVAITSFIGAVIISQCLNYIKENR